MIWSDVSKILNGFKAYIYKKVPKSRTLWIGGSGGTIIGFLMILALLTGVQIQTTGDVECGSVCESYINITTSYWRICFDNTFQPIFTDGNVKTELYVPTYGNKWRLWDASKDCIERGKINKFKLIGYKKPSDTVKWGIGLGTAFKDEVDPLWLGTTEGEKFWYNTGYPYANESYRISDFINRSGVNFTLAGQPYHFIGTDSYYITDYATNLTYDDDGHQINNSRQYAIELLNEMQYLNINVFRTWAGIQCGGRGSTAWNQSNYGGHYNCFENDAPGNFNETMFEALDWVIYEASKRDIRVMLVLVNTWNDYGGMRWYTQQSPTTDKTNENVSDTSLAAYWQFHDQFYNDTSAILYFQNFTNHTLWRNNTLTGRYYKDEPAIFGWVLANEPRAKSDAPKWDLLSDWTLNMTTFIKNIDTNHLVGLGLEGWGYNETWGEGTNFIHNQNNTGVDFVTYALHPDQWGYFAERSENSTNGSWIIGGIFNNSNIDWWTNSDNNTYNSRYSGNYPNYIPDLGRHGYKDWVRQNVDWANTLNMPVILQELGINTSHTYFVKSKFYNQTMDNFYGSGGDGLLLWTLNHDEYYYSTTVDGDMDDGFGFYVSDDTFLKNKSQAGIDAIQRAMDLGYVNIMNSFKYDFILNVGLNSSHNTSTYPTDPNMALNMWFEQSNTTNDVVDSSGNLNNGTVARYITNCTEANEDNECTWTTGLISNGLQLSNYEFLPVSTVTYPALNFSGNFTVGMWAKWTGAGTPGKGLASRSTYTSDWALGTSGGKIYVRCKYTGAVTATGTTDIPSNVWYYYTFVHNSTDILAYLNGTLEASASVTDCGAAVANVVIGSYTYDYRYNPLITTWIGAIDEVRMWNRSLSIEEIQAIYGNESLGIADPNMNATGLVGEWHLDETTGNTTADTSSSGATAKLMGYTRPVFSRAGGIAGGAYSFDGRNDQEVGLSFGGNKPYNIGFLWNWTFSVWIKANQLPTGTGYYTIFRQGAAPAAAGDHVMVYLNSSGVGLQYMTNNTKIAGLNKTSNPISAGAWHHIAVTRDFDGINNLTNFYIDGVLDSSITNNWFNAYQYFTYGNPCYIGQHSYALGHFNGTIDELMIWNRTLSSGEISGLYNMTSLGTVSSSSLYLKLYNGSDWTDWAINQTNSSAITNDTDYTFTTQFENDVEEFKWYIQTCDNYDLCINSSIGTLDLGTDPSITLFEPNNDSYFKEEEVEIKYSVTGSLDISNCQLYINNILNETDSVITKDISQYFYKNVSSNPREYIWRIECTDVGDRTGVSENQTFYVDNITPNIEFTSPTLNNNTYFNDTGVYINYSVNDTNFGYSFINYDNSLVGWWRMEENAGDDSGNENNGTVYGAVNTTGRVGRGYEFDGVDDNISMGDINAMDSIPETTWSAWVKPNSLTLRDSVLDKGFWGMYVHWTSTDDVFVYVGSVAAYCGTSGNFLAVNQWGLWTMVFDGNLSGYDKISFYFNGVEQALTCSGTLSTTTPATAAPFVIGDNNDAANRRYFNGTIDEVAIWNRSLSAEEVVALYNATQTYHNFTDLSIGNHTFKAYILDRTGNINSTETLQLNTEVTPPIISLVYPINNSWLESIYTNFTYNITDGSNISSCYLYLMNNGTYEINTTDATILRDANQTFNLTVDQGLTRWKIGCNDTLNNKANSTEWEIWNWTVVLTNATDFNIDSNTWYTNNSLQPEGQNSTQGVFKFVYHKGSQFALYIGVNESMPSGINITLDTDNNISGGVNLTTTLQFLRYLGDIEEGFKYIWAWVGLNNASLGAYMPGIEFETREVN